MVLSETLVLPLCPPAGGSGAPTFLPTDRTRKAPATIATITSRLRTASSVVVGGAVTGLALHPDADPGLAHGEDHGRQQDHDEKGPQGLGEHRPPEPRCRVRRDPELEERRGGRAEVRVAGGQLPGSGGH